MRPPRCPLLLPLGAELGALAKLTSPQPAAAPCLIHLLHLIDILPVPT